MAVEDNRKKNAGWERKIFDFAVNHKLARYLYYSPEAAVIMPYNLIKINDDYYASCSNPNKWFKYVMDLVAYKTKNNMPIDKAAKYSGWEQTLFNYIEKHKPADNEFTIQLSYEVTLRIRYLYSSPEVTSIEVSYNFSKQPKTMILIKIKDNYHAAYLNGLSWPPHEDILATIDSMLTERAQPEIDLFAIYPASLKITKIENMEKETHISIKSQTHIQVCPSCKQECNEHHSTYRRKIQDLPILGKTVYIHLTAYRYYCHNSECDQKVFCETVDGFFEFYKRITGRLEDFIIALALNTSCEGASRVSRLIGIKMSGDTLIRIVKQEANKKERLKENKRVKIVTRDMASAYASIISKVLSEATQTANRFHSRQKLLAAIKNVTTR